MKVSVVIPAYNEELHIKATLDAVLKQTYHNFEIIVVDNGSVDKTSEIAKSFGKKVKVLHESRKGTQWARECGRLEAKGEIIANVDADCLPDIDWLEKGMHNFLAKNVVAVGGPYDYYDAPVLSRWFSLVFQKVMYFFMNWLMQKIGKGAVLIGGNMLMRADTLEKTGGYNTKLVFYGDDTDTAKRMAREGKVVFDRRLPMKTSYRRLKAHGIFKTSIVYIYHFFKVIFAKD